MLRHPSYVSRAAILVLLAALLGLAVLITTQFSGHAFAATAAAHGGTGGTLCSQQPTFQHCQGQDPEAQGCAADAETLGNTIPIVNQNKQTIGSIQRRWSARCQSWWGRVFDIRPGAQGNMTIAVGGTTLAAPPTFVNPTPSYRILYSTMVFDATPKQQVPAITGTLLINGTPTSATIDAITIPAHTPVSIQP